jgi:hypothetical protein
MDVKLQDKVSTFKSLIGMKKLALVEKSINDTGYLFKLFKIF